MCKTSTTNGLIKGAFFSALLLGKKINSKLHNFSKAEIRKEIGSSPF